LFSPSDEKTKFGELIECGREYNFDRKKVEIDRVNQYEWLLRLTAEFLFTIRHFPRQTRRNECRKKIKRERSAFARPLR